MANKEMPIREYLQGEFNERVNKKGYTPFEAYVQLEAALADRALFYDTYAQATITSAGHARNPNLSWLEIVKKNVAYGQGMAEELYKTGELDPEKTIEATTLGLIHHWKESDYITFWLSTLGRPEFAGYGQAQQVREIHDRLNSELHKRDIDLDIFNDYTLDPERRAPNYFLLADAYADMLETMDHAPIQKLVAVSETHDSLGASTERYFAKKLGARVYGLAIAQLGASTLPDDYPAPTLVRDTESIVKYGGRVFDARRETRILLVEQ